MENIIRMEKVNRPWVVAHRGYRGLYPENTLAAFEAAIAVGAEMVDLDVSLTRDRVPVVIHDNTLYRTTDGKGLVSEHSLSELKELDAGSWFSSEFKGEAVPTLEEVLQLVRGKISVNIEIKRGSFEAAAPTDAIEFQICELVERMNMVDSVLISSFEHFIFPRVQRWYRNHGKSSVLRIAPLQVAPLSEELALGLCQRQNAYSYNPNENNVTQSLIEIMKAGGFRIFPYTINDEKRMEQLIKWGATGIISDEPELLWKVIRNLKDDE